MQQLNVYEISLMLPIKWVLFMLQAIPEERLIRAENEIKKSIKMAAATLGGDDFWTNKVHNAALHMLQDCRKHGTHLDALSAYPFENFHIIWHNLLRSGNKPLAQIR
jgi:hypothetical protein